MAHHVDRIVPLDPQVLINEIWYYLVKSAICSKDWNVFSPTPEQSNDYKMVLAAIRELKGLLELRRFLSPKLDPFRNGQYI
jgi:hypothetical protein